MESKKIITKEEVDELNRQQNEGRFHPYTCLNDGDELHISYEFQKSHPGENFEEYIKKEKARGIPYPDAVFNQTNLIATEEGWLCPVCDYKQNHR